MNFTSKNTLCKNTAMIAAVLALIVIIPSCHLIQPAYMPVPPVSGNTIRVRLTTKAPQLTLGSASVISFSSDRREELTVNGKFSQKIKRNRNEWKINGRSIFSPYLVVRSYSSTQLLKADGRHYRGRIILSAVEGSDTLFSVDNHLPLEQYLAGVLNKELPSSWHEETFKALSIAARTYAVYEMQNGGKNRNFDVYDDQSSQVYGGADAETYKSVMAVTETSGMVLTTGNPGNYRVFKTFFSSTCGGVTNPVKALVHISESPAPLRGGIVCEDCHFSPKYKWAKVKLTRAEVFEALVNNYPQLKELQSLESVTIEESTEWGRAIWLDLKGTNGKHERVRAEDLRLVLLRYGPKSAKKLYSMNCRITTEGDYIIFSEGRGFGHGVGLCQYGAEGKARRGMKYYQILYAYYPGAIISHISR